jgi:hypothetical protein
MQTLPSSTSFSLPFQVDLIEIGNSGPFSENLEILSDFFFEVACDHGT